MQLTVSEYKSYNHLLLNERIRIEILLICGKTQSEIAVAIGRSQSTVSRELKRNQPLKNKVKYNAERAHTRSNESKWNATAKERLSNPLIREYISERIMIGGSPEQIAGRIGVDKP
ncbi:MAG: helix-turn-helix domain-containing protein [Methanosarcinales archaeon]|jgi:IS30 family transposase|nr:helix-turn-helix domain-containing protein [Methanosarcinales archaeon]